MLLARNAKFINFPRHLHSPRERGTSAVPWAIRATRQGGYANRRQDTPEPGE